MSDEIIMMDPKWKRPVFFLMVIACVVLPAVFVWAHVAHPEWFPPTPEGQRLEGGTEDFNGACLIVYVMLLAFTVGLGVDVFRKRGTETGEQRAGTCQRR